MLCKRNKIWKP